MADRTVYKKGQEPVYDSTKFQLAAGGGALGGAFLIILNWLVPTMPAEVGWAIIMVVSTFAASLVTYFGPANRLLRPGVPVSEPPPGPLHP